LNVGIASVVHSKHQRGYSNIQNTIELIPTFKTSERLFQLSKHHRGYSNFQNTRGCPLSGVVNVGIASMVF
jgi:hypothetical protein